jgi:hypothetical protein
VLKDKSKLIPNVNMGMPDAGVLFLVIEGPTGTGQSDDMSIALADNTSS